MENLIRKRRRRRSVTQAAPFSWETKRGVQSLRQAKIHKWNRIIQVSTAMIVIVGVVLAVLLYMRDEQATKEVPKVSEKKSPVIQVSEPPPTPEAKSEAVIAALLGFVNDSTHEARSQRIFGKADGLKHLESYYDQRGNTLPRRIINPSVSAVQFKDRELLLVAFLDENGRKWSAPFEWDGASYRLHWEAMTGFGEISWREFFENRPKGVFTMRANFFLPETDTFDPLASDHLVVLLSHPDLARPVSVLVPSGSEIHRQLASYPRAADIPGIVEIKWQQGNGDQPVLTRWIQRDWIQGALQIKRISTPSVIFPAKAQ